MSEKSNNKLLNSGDVINSIGQERGWGGVVTSNCVALCVLLTSLWFRFPSVSQSVKRGYKP